MPVIFDSDDEICHAQMDDGKVNALSHALISELRSAVSTASSAGKPLVISGRPGCFSAGFDLSVMRSGDDTAVAALLLQGERLFEDLLSAPIPVLAACTGHALAAGALLLLSIDYRIGTTGPAKIGLNEVRIGMALPRFAVALARYRLDHRTLTSATALAEVGDAARAREMGYLDSIADDPVAAARSYATDLASFDAASRTAFATTKRRVREPLRAELAEIEKSAQSEGGSGI